LHDRGIAQQAARLWLSARKWLQQADFLIVAGFAEQFPLDTTYGK
jgi:hypothetical protein